MVICFRSAVKKMGQAQVLCMVLAVFALKWCGRDVPCSSIFIDETSRTTINLPTSSSICNHTLLTRSAVEC